MATADSEKSSGKVTVPTSGFVHSLFVGSTDSRIAHLNKILATASGVDTTLTLVGYSLFFVASQLSRLQNLQLQALLKRLSLNNALAAGPSIATLTVSLKTIAGMCSDFRAFTRLWGLLGVWAAVKRNYLNPPKDSIVRSLAWGQTASLGAYLVYENGYYLAGKGVLTGWSPEKQKRWAKTSLKMFLAYVLLEWVRLFRQRQLREEERSSGNPSGERVTALNQEDELATRTAIIDAAYTPLCFHWASANGMLSEGWVGALMSVVGLVKFRAAWAQTA